MLLPFGTACGPWRVYVKFVGFDEPECLVRHDETMTRRQWLSREAGGSLNDTPHVGVRGGTEASGTGVSVPSLTGGWINLAGRSPSQTDY